MVGIVIIGMILSFFNAMDCSPVLGTSTSPPMSEYAEKELNSLEERISFVKLCESNPNSKWIDGKCYYFLQEIQSYEDAQYECSGRFEKNVSGRIYEPRNHANFKLIFKTADLIESLLPIVNHLLFICTLKISDSFFTKDLYFFFYTWKKGRR